MVDPASIERTRQNRLADLVAYARANSPYYRQLYEGLPERIEDQAVLPVTNKASLMARFDDWATDREVTRERVEAFLADPSSVGKKFLGKYRVATTSGVTGNRMTFVVDQRSDEIIRSTTKQMMLPMLGWLGAIKFLFQSTILHARTASVIATGSHTAAFSRVTISDLSERRKVLSVHTPLRDLVAQLNEIRPTFLQGYASTISMLADEEEAGRLHIRPSFVLPTSEGLTDKQYENIARAFKAKVGTMYGGTECGPPVAWSCKERWLHLNSEWAVVEPVDENFKPAAPGTPSHTVLVSNLTNYVLPILRYDMGDSVIVRPEKCPCGNPMPAVRVVGRVADVLVFGPPEGVQTKLTSLQLATVVDLTPGVQLFQVVQTSPATLRLRLRTVEGVDAGVVWQKVVGRLQELLGNSGLDWVKVERATEPPEQAAGGKYREVIPLKP